MGAVLPGATTWREAKEGGMHSEGCVVIHEPKEEGVCKGLGLATPVWGAGKLLRHVRDVYGAGAGWSHACQLGAVGGLLIRMAAEHG